MVNEPVTFGPYQVVRELGRGGMGAVYLGRDAQGRHVAIKSLENVAGANNLDAMRAIRREIQLLRGLEHPHVVGVIDSEVSGARPWYAMEYVEGHTLSDLVAEGVDREHASTLLPTLKTPTSFDDAARVAGRGVAGWDHLTQAALGWIAQIAHALAYMHGEGLIHGDLKPHNILVSDRRAVLIDFGLADRVEGRVTLAGLRRAQLDAHTPGYASPECLRSERLDPRTDLYAIGCLIFEVVTGRLPFEGSIVEVAHGHLALEPPRLRSVVDTVPKPLDQLVARLLAKEPADRPGHALDVIATLASIGIEPPQMKLPDVQPYLYAAPIVGRDEHLERLLERARSPQKEHGTLLVTGESGVGKSTLAQHAVKASSRSDARVVVTIGTRIGRDDDDPIVPFDALRGVFDEIVDFAETSDDPRAVLGDDVLFVVPFDDRLARWVDRDVPVLKDPIGAASRALTAILTRMCATGGLLLVCDELQWFDPAAMQTLRLLAAQAAQRPWLILMLARSDEFDVDAHATLLHGAETISLGPLNEDETGASVAGMLGVAAVDADVSRVVHQRCGGNPYYVREFLKVALAERALRLDRSGAWIGANRRSLADAFRRLPEPQSVMELTRRRLAMLDEDVLDVARRAAVVGREFSLWLISEHPDERLDQALNTLSTRDIVEPTLDPMAMRFSHDRLREALLGDLAATERRALHEAVAGRMSSADYDPALVAWHYERAENRALATQQWLLAADRARARQTKQMLATALEHALSLGGELIGAEEELRLRVERAMALTDSEQHPEAIAEARELLALELPSSLRGELLTSLGRSEWRTGDVDASLRSTAEALDLIAPDAQPRAFASALATRADALDVVGETEQALIAYERVLELADVHELVEVRTRTLNNVGLVHRGLGDYEQAARLIAAAVKSARESHDRWRESLLTSNLGWVFSDQGHYDDALAEYARSLEIAEELGDAHALALNHQRIGIVHMERAEFEEAIRYLRLSEAHHQRTNMAGALGYVIINQAVVRLEQGRFDHAEALARRGLALVEGKFLGDELFAITTIGSVQRQDERWEQARTTLSRSLELSVEHGMRANECLTLYELSLLESYSGDAVTGVELAHAAGELARELGSMGLVATSLFAEGAALHRAGEPRAALEKLTSAFYAFNDHQRRWLACLAASEAVFASRHVQGADGEAWLQRADDLLEAMQLEPRAMPSRVCRHAKDLEDS